MTKTSLILTKHHRIFHYLNDGNGNLTFQVKVFGLASEIPIVIDGLIVLPTLATLIRGLSLRGYF